MKDAVEASMLVFGCQHCAPEVINIGTGKPTTINELAKVLMSMFKETGVKLEYAALRAGDIRNSHADVSKAGRVLATSRASVWKREQDGRFKVRI